MPRNDAAEQVVAGDRQAVLAGGDVAARGVEADGARRALGRPVGDAERDREDDRRHHQRLDVDLREERHRTASGRGSPRSKRAALLVGDRRRGDRVRERVELVLGLAQVPDAEHEDHQELRQRIAVADGQPLIDRLAHEVRRVAGHDDERHVVGEEEDRRGYDEAPPALDELAELLRALDAFPVHHRVSPPWTVWGDRTRGRRNRKPGIDQRWLWRDERSRHHGDQPV